MESSCIGLNDLPDEILMIIFQKLNNLEVLYSFQSVNQRLTTIVHDPIFTSCLTFVKRVAHNFIDLICCDTILDRFCLQILPEIHDQVQWLDLESSSMKHVLRAVDYPNLHGLGLYNIDEDSARCFFTDETLSSGVFKNQITTLLITINKNYEEMQLSVANICDYIFSVFTGLVVLSLHESSYKNRVRLNFDDPLPPNFHSSTLLKLNINVQCFDVCLYLLDGRFNQLHTLCIDLVNTHYSQDIQNQGDLPNLKCFSLSCNFYTYDYDQTILPLLHRMSNLEQLTLHIMVCVKKIFIDGNHLQRNIINRMLRLSYLTFCIVSFMFARNQMDVPSTEDIRRTFVNFPKSEIISYVDYFPERKQSSCHVYSYPCRTEFYGDITNSFPGGLFNYVRVVSLFDEHPFEHEFFFQIAKSFPFMEELAMSNQKPQKHKRSHQSNNDNRNSVVEYSSLHKLILSDVHDDYIEQFLCDTKTYLSNNVTLCTAYESLERATHTFTRDATRMNCTKINKLDMRGKSKHSNSLQEYFPYAKICYS